MHWVEFVPFPEDPGQLIKYKNVFFLNLFTRNKRLVYLWYLFVISTHVNSFIKGPFKNKNVS